MTLREELAGIPGVINADIDLRDGQPTAIRIHSGEGADQRAIGEAVQHALRRHGLRSRVAPPRTTVEPPSAPAPPPHLSLMPGLQSGKPAPPVQNVEEPVRRLATVAARDDGRRTVVTVTDDRGGAAEEPCRRSRSDQVIATLKAVGRLFDADAEPPRLLSVQRWEHDGSEFVTVIVDVGGDTHVGSARDDGLELRAVALAVWQALSA